MSTHVETIDLGNEPVILSSIAALKAIRPRVEELLGPCCGHAQALGFVVAHALGDQATDHQIDTVLLQAALNISRFYVAPTVGAMTFDEAIGLSASLLTGAAHEALECINDPTYQAASAIAASGALRGSVPQLVVRVPTAPKGTDTKH